MKKFLKMSVFLSALTGFLAACTQEVAEVKIYNHASSGSSGQEIESNPFKASVEENDTIYTIANSLGVSTRELIEVNNLRPPYTLTAGQTLRLPKPQFHNVGKGDTIYAISRSYKVNVSSIIRENDLTENFVITPGQKIRIPYQTTLSEEDQNYEPIETAEARPLVSDRSVVSSSDLDPIAAEPIDNENVLSNEDAAVSENIPIDDDVTSRDLSPVAQDAPEPVVIATPSASNEIPVPAEVETEVAGDIDNSESGAIDLAAPKPVLKTDSADPVIKEELKKENMANASPVISEESTAVPVSAEPVSSSQEMVIQKDLQFSWPLSGKIVSDFGPKDGGLYNDGINISAKEGDHIKAAEGGYVVYSGNELKGYGNLLLIKHEDGYVTAYAHNRNNLVKKGDSVKKGDIIASVGKTGHVDSPQLHFSIRKGRKALDPQKYLTSSYSMVN